MSKKLTALALVLCLTTVLSGCAMVTQSPLTGFIFTDLNAPLAVTDNDRGGKVGDAEAMSILGWVATGDASIQKAAQKAGITKIHHVDFHAWSVLGIIAKYRVYVYGD